MVKKDIVLFGTENILKIIYCAKAGELGKVPLFAVDNDSARAGNFRCGIKVKLPETTVDAGQRYFLCNHLRNAEGGD